MYLNKPQYIEKEGIIFFVVVICLNISELAYATISLIVCG